jgi:hypothetical protein
LEEFAPNAIFTQIIPQKQKGDSEELPKLLILMVAWDGIELPTRRFSDFEFIFLEFV